MNLDPILSTQLLYIHTLQKISPAQQQQDTRYIIWRVPFIVRPGDHDMRLVDKQNQIVLLFVFLHM